VTGTTRSRRTRLTCKDRSSSELPTDSRAPVSCFTFAVGTGRCHPAQSTRLRRPAARDRSGSKSSPTSYSISCPDTRSAERERHSVLEASQQSQAAMKFRRSRTARANNGGRNPFFQMRPKTRERTKPFRSRIQRVDSWLGRQDSNLGMAESKSKWFALFIKAHSETMRKFDLSSIKRLGNISECRALSQ
jgi:hypothetical protein